MFDDFEISEFHRVVLYEYGEKIYEAKLESDGEEGTIVRCATLGDGIDLVIAHTLLLSLAHLVPPHLSVKCLSVAAAIGAILDEDPSITRHP